MADYAPVASNMGGEVRVTVGITTYSLSRLRYLKEAVESALGQTYSNIEVLISQNPHPDPSATQAIAEYCREQARRDPRVRHKINARNLGPVANMNSVADEARGEYLALIGDDDRLLPDAIEKMLAAAAPETSIVFCNLYIIDSEGRRLEQDSLECTRWYGRDRIPAGPVASPEMWAWRLSLSNEAALIRTSDFRRVRFAEDILVCDVEFFIRMARQVGDFVFVPEYLSEIRSHGESMTANYMTGYDVLVSRLERLAVTADVEPYKTKLLEYLKFHAVSQALLAGQARHAREMLRTRHHHVGVRAACRRIVMELCARLPGDIGISFYRALSRMSRAGILRQGVMQRTILQHCARKDRDRDFAIGNTARL
jgi:glycosyltransferase involved in cell wall biosynthesis